MISDEAVAELLRRQMGEAPDQDEEGVWSIVIDDRLPVFLRVIQETGALFASAGIGSVADDCPAGVLRQLLAANPYWQAHSGLGVGLIPGTSSVLLTGRFTDDDAGERLDHWFEDFIQAAFSWRDELGRMTSVDDVEPVVETEEIEAAHPLAEPSHLQDFV